MNKNNKPNSRGGVCPRPFDVIAHDYRDFVQKMELKVLMRRDFYASLKRRPPTAVAHMPSYVRAARKHWGLLSNNAARALLAQIEGFESWEEMLSHNALPAQNALTCKEISNVIHSETNHEN